VVNKHEYIKTGKTSVIVNASLACLLTYLHTGASSAETSVEEATGLERAGSICSVAGLRRLVDESKHFVDHFRVVNGSVSTLLGDIYSLLLVRSFLSLSRIFLRNFAVYASQSLLHQQSRRYTHTYFTLVSKVSKYDYFYGAE